MPLPRVRGRSSGVEKQADLKSQPTITLPDSRAQASTLGLPPEILGEWCLGVLLLGGVAVVAFTGPRGAYSPGAALATALLFGLIFVSLLDIVRFEPASRRRSAVTGWDVVIALALALPAYGLMAALLNALVLRLY